MIDDIFWWLLSSMAVQVNNPTAGVLTNVFFRIKRRFLFLARWASPRLLFKKWARINCEFPQPRMATWWLYFDVNDSLQSLNWCFQSRPKHKSVLGNEVLIKRPPVDCDNGFYPSKQPACGSSVSNVRQGNAKRASWCQIFKQTNMSLLFLRFLALLLIRPRVMKRRPRR